MGERPLSPNFPTPLPTLAQSPLLPCPPLWGLYILEFLKAESQPQFSTNSIFPSCSHLLPAFQKPLLTDDPKIWIPSSAHGIPDLQILHIYFGISKATFNSFIQQTSIKYFLWVWHDLSMSKYIINSTNGASFYFPNLRMPSRGVVHKPGGHPWPFLLIHHSPLRY